MSSSLVSGALNVFKRAYKRNVGNTLRKYGLRYEDLLIVDHPDVEWALKYIPEEERMNRGRRIKRALHLSLIHDYLPEEIQKQQTPFQSYMAKEIEMARVLREEKERLNNF